jgi:hypothetical protein
VANFKTLACVGLNGFERARLRLLLGEAGRRMGVSWRLGQPEEADLMLLAAGSGEAEAAGMLARGRGVRCVRMGVALSDAEVTLPAGFDIDDLVRVLSSAELPVAGFRSVDAATPEFFDLPESRTEAEDGAKASPAQVPEAVDLERYLRRDSEEYSLDRIVPQHLMEDTALEPVDRKLPSSRADVRGDERNPYAPRVPAPPEGAPMQVHETRPPAASATHAGRPLGDYLDGERLMAPCQLVLQGSEPLILDPKNRVYLIVGDLESVEPYVQGTYTDADFERLTTRELERWRALCDAQPFLRLKWLLALRRGDGWLPRHLDPGGSFRLRRSLELGEHFAPQIRVGRVLADWHPLHEVAALARVDMQTVFNTLAAYDVIDWLEEQPRERFRHR